MLLGAVGQRVEGLRRDARVRNSAQQPREEVRRVDLAQVAAEKAADKMSERDHPPSPAICLALACSIDRWYGWVHGPAVHHKYWQLTLLCYNNVVLQVMLHVRCCVQ